MPAFILKGGILQVVAQVLCEVASNCLELTLKTRIVSYTLRNVSDERASIPYCLFGRKPGHILDKIESYANEGTLKPSLVASRLFAS